MGATPQGWLIAAVYGVLFCIPGRSAFADTLTCDAFRTRLGESIGALGDRVARPGPFKPGYDAGVGKRFDWSGLAGLSGTMTCGKAEAFEDFAIAIDETARTSDALPEALRGFMEMASASVCALAEAPPDACRALVERMTVESLAQFKTASSKADAPTGTLPAGTRDFFIVEGVDAELDMTPVGISWSVGPGLSMTVDARKKPLDPRNADER